jgi:hypothetical protein
VPGLPLNDKLRGLDSLRQRRPLSGGVGACLGRQHTYAAQAGAQEPPPAEELLSGLEREQGQGQGGALAAGGGPERCFGGGYGVSFSSPQQAGRRSFMGVPSGSRRASRRTAAALAGEGTEDSEQDAAAAGRARAKSSSEIKEELEQQLEAKAAGLNDDWGLEVLVRVSGRRCRRRLRLLSCRARRSAAKQPGWAAAAQITSPAA